VQLAVGVLPWYVSLTADCTAQTVCTEVLVCMTGTGLLDFSSRFQYQSRSCTETAPRVEISLTSLENNQLKLVDFKSFLRVFSLALVPLIVPNKSSSWSLVVRRQVFVCFLFKLLLFSSKTGCSTEVHEAQ